MAEFEKIRGNSGAEGPDRNRPVEPHPDEAMNLAAGKSHAIDARLLPLFGAYSESAWTKCVGVSENPSLLDAVRSYEEFSAWIDNNAGLISKSRLDRAKSCFGRAFIEVLAEVLERGNHLESHTASGVEDGDLHARAVKALNASADVTKHPGNERVVATIKGKLAEAFSNTGPAETLEIQPERNVKDNPVPKGSNGTSQISVNHFLGALIPSGQTCITIGTTVSAVGAAFFTSWGISKVSIGFATALHAPILAGVCSGVAFFCALKVGGSIWRAGARLLERSIHNAVIQPFDNYLTGVYHPAEGAKELRRGLKALSRIMGISNRIRPDGTVSQAPSGLSWNPLKWPRLAVQIPYFLLDTVLGGKTYSSSWNPAKRNLEALNLGRFAEDYAALVKLFEQRAVNFNVSTDMEQALVRKELANKVRQIQERIEENEEILTRMGMPDTNPVRQIMRRHHPVIAAVSKIFERTLHNSDDSVRLKWKGTAFFGGIFIYAGIAYLGWGHYNLFQAFAHPLDTMQSLFSEPAVQHVASNGVLNTASELWEMARKAGWHVKTFISGK